MKFMTIFAFIVLAISAVAVMTLSQIGFGLGLEQTAPVGRRIQFDASHVTGWSLMTPQERLIYRDRMLIASTYDECINIQQFHRADMIERAEDRGVRLVSPPQDTCDWMRGRGLYRQHPR